MEWRVEVSDVLPTRIRRGHSSDAAKKCSFFLGRAWIEHNPTTATLGVVYNPSSGKKHFFLVFFLSFKIKLTNSKEKAEENTNHWPFRVSSPSRFWFPPLHDTVRRCLNSNSVHWCCRRMVQLCRCCCSNLNQTTTIQCLLCHDSQPRIRLRRRRRTRTRG